MEDDYIQLIPSGGRPSSHELLKMEIGRHWEAEAETETDDKRSQFIDEVSYQESCVDFDEASCRAPPLQDMYRYHVFFSHSADDIDWVRQTIGRLQSPPFCYQCYYLCDKFHHRLSIVQNLQCALMLSERVILVLTKQYVTDTWPDFLTMMKSLTSASLRQLRMLVLVLDECGIPAELEHNEFLDARDCDFFRMLVTRLKSDRLPRSSLSISSDTAAEVSSSLENGHILASVDVSMSGAWQPHLAVADPNTEIPTSLKWHGVNMNQSEYTELLRGMTHVYRASSRLPWILGIQPVLVLLSTFGLWVVVTVLVIVLPGQRIAGDILPVRLVVFIVPLILLSLLYTVRWKRRHIKRKISRQMLYLCVHVNSSLYLDDRPLVVTAAHNKGRRFTKDVSLLINSCLTEDVEKLSHMIQFYTKDDKFLSEVSLAERLTVMMAAAFTLKLTNHMLPYSPQERHTDKLLCLCQFTEECVSSYVHYVTKEDVTGVVQLFSVNLFCAITSKDIKRMFENMLSG